MDALPTHRMLARGARWLWPTITYLVVTAALALGIHNAGHPMRFAEAALVSKWFPIAFLIQAIVIVSFALTMRSSAQFQNSYLIDLAGWSAPVTMAIAVHLGSTDYAAWLTVAVFGKFGAGVAALILAAGKGPGDRHIALAMATLALILYCLTVPYTRLGTAATHAVELAGDEPHYMVVTSSLVHGHGLFVEDEYKQNVYYTWYPSDLGLGATTPARDGHRASFHDIGLPLLGAIPYAIGGWQLVLFAIAFLAAWILAEIYLMVRLAGADRSIAVVTTALLATSAPFVVYANYNFPEIPMALAAVVALRRIWLAERTAVRVPLANAAIAGVAIATLPWLQTRGWLLVLGLVLAGLFVWRTRPSRIAIVAPLAVGTLAYIALNSWVFGRPTLSPYIAGRAALAPYVAGPQPGSLVADALIAQARPWLDGYDGLLLLAPVFILALVGVPLLFRQGWAGRGTLLAAALYAATIGATEIYVPAGWGPPGRYMVTAMPILAVPLALALQQIQRHRSALPLIAVPVIGWGMACTFITFTDRLATYSATALDSTTNGPAERLGAMLGIPVLRLLPHFNAPPTLAAFGKVALSVAIVVLGAVIIDRSARSRIVFDLLTPSTRVRISINGDKMASLNDTLIRTRARDAPHEASPIVEVHSESRDDGG
ncbi:MAG: hypothetical protein J2P57_00060 [Acidimicrobiaceae bacterium]|nr:hypothetical protein [Acidimicrobiaceae bacterium]